MNTLKQGTKRGDKSNVGSLRIRFRKLGKERAAGLYWGKKHLIEVDPRQNSRDLCDTLIHEAIHHTAPDLNEDAVWRLSHDITSVLWTMGYRRIQD